MIKEMEKDKVKSFSVSKPLVYSLAFTIALAIFEGIFLRQNEELSVLSRHFADGSYGRLIFICFLSALSFVLTYFFVFCSFDSSRKYRIIYFLIFCLAVCIEYGYQNAFQRFSLLEDLEIAYVAADLKMARNSALAYFNYLSLFPVAAYLLLLLLINSGSRKNLSKLLWPFLAFVSFFFFTAFFTRNTFYTSSVAALSRTLVSFPVTWYVGSLKSPPRQLLYYAKRTEIGFQSPSQPINNVVLIIDESVRGDHLSLNGYERKTTPFLDELNQKGFIKNWGIAVSGATCSLTSNRLLLTGLNNLPDRDYEIYKMPTIFQYAEAMNYKNYYFDGSIAHFWNGKFSDIADYGKWTKADELNTANRYENDAEIGRRVNEIVRNSTGNFIWINKFGMHPPYGNSYPSSETIWAPVSGTDSYKDFYSKEATVETLKNGYDNAILYNSQSFFSTLLGGGLSPNTIYIYTSDHGQTLSENGETVSHCSNSPTEARVPLFIIANPEILPNADTGYAASHANLFATLLDMMSFPQDARKYDYSISLLRARKSDSQPRSYFVGDLNGMENGQKYFYDK